MHFVIVGPGALGCLLASFLSRGKESTDTISLLDYSEKRAEIINRGGILYENGDVNRSWPIKVFSDPAEIGHCDVLLLCVKSYAVEQTLYFISPLLRSTTLLIFMQNGIGHLAQKDRVGEASAAFATTTEGATTLGPGHVRHAGSGLTHLGFLEPQLQQNIDLLAVVAKRLNHGGAKARISDTILSRIWNKLLINVGINGLTVIHDCKNGELANNPVALAQMKEVVEEAQRVARHEQISVSTTFEDTVDVCRATAGNISSMLQDIRRGRKTEIDAINGAILRLAESHNLSTPTNLRLVSDVKKREKSALYNENSS